MKPVGRKDPDQQWDAEDTAECDGIRQVHTVTISNYPPLATTKAMNWGGPREGVLRRAPDRRATQKTRRHLLVLFSDDLAPDFLVSGFGNNVPPHQFGLGLV